MTFQARRAIAGRVRGWILRRACGGGFTAVLTLSIACGGCSPVTHSDAGARAAHPSVDRRVGVTSAIALDASRGDPVEFRFIGVAPDSALLAIESRTGAWWRVPAAGAPQRLTVARGATHPRALIAAVAGSRVATADIAGNVTEDAAEARVPAVAVRRPLMHRGQLLGFARLPDGSYLTLESRLYAGALAPMPVDTLRVVHLVAPSSERVLWTMERAGPANPYGSMTDFVSLAAFGDTVVIAASAPPRAIWWIHGDVPDVHAASLRGVPTAPMSARARARLEEFLRRRGVGADGVGTSTAVFPPVVAARPFRGAWFVVGGAGEERFALSAVCANGTVSVLLDAPDVSWIFLQPGEATVLRRQPGTTRATIERTPYTSFETGCHR